MGRRTTRRTSQAPVTMERRFASKHNCAQASHGGKRENYQHRLALFGDASGRGFSAASYAVVTQPSGVNVGLVTAKARLAKQGLSIPRLELVSGHMAINLMTNTRDALEGFPVSEIYCWLDGTVALHWIRGAGN